MKELLEAIELEGLFQSTKRKKESRRRFLWRWLTSVKTAQTEVPELRAVQEA